MAKLITGTRVRLTGQFLRNTGQLTGGEGQKTWTVQECSCSLCTDSERFVAVNEPRYDAPELLRHIASANLYKDGTLDHRNA
jgi:hypothetical protein